MNGLEGAHPPLKCALPAPNSYLELTRTPLSVNEGAHLCARCLIMPLIRIWKWGAHCARTPVHPKRTHTPSPLGEVCGAAVRVFSMVVGRVHYEGSHA